MRWLITALGVASMVAAIACASADAAGWTQFPVPAAAIAAGPDGNLWVTDGNSIDRITSSGSSTSFTLANPPFVSGIAAGTDGSLWFMEYGFIGRITTSGTISEFPVPTTNVSCVQTFDSLGGIITAGPDGNIWFTNLLDSIERITPTGTLSSFAAGCVTALTNGPDGNVWFTTDTSIGRITPTGTITTFTIPTANAGAQAITTGPDGNLWFTETNANQIGRISPSGTITEFPIPAPFTNPAAITSGPDGNLWFTNYFPLGVPIGSGFGPEVGRITTAGLVSETAGPAGVGITAGPDGNLWIAGGGFTIRFPPLLIPANTMPPSITGSSVQGQTLHEAHGAWTNSPVTYAYQWERCATSSGPLVCSSIPGATAADYTLTSSDVGHSIRVDETAITGAGGVSDSAASDLTGPVQAMPVQATPPPIGTAPPSISGIAVVGQRLTETHGTWTNGPISGYSYRWERCNQAGSGCSPLAATSQTFTLTGADANHTIRVSESATNPGGTSAPTTSKATPLVMALIRISALRVAPRTFRAALKGASVSHKQAVGARVGFSLSAGGQVRFTVQRITQGRRAGRRCLPLPHRKSTSPRCTRYIAVAGSFVVNGNVGINGFRFSGRVGGKTLHRGNYRLIATSTTGPFTTNATARFTVRP